jgi:uncharacterized phage protein (TIGR02218 family)
MRNASGSLITLLNSQNQYCIADLLTIIQPNGVITRLTSADIDITSISQVDGLSHTFSSTGPRFSRTRTKLVVGLEVDSMTVTIMPDPALHTLGSQPWPAAAAAGALDEARIVLERAFMATWGDTSAGTIIQFAGRIGQVTASRTTLVLQVNSDLELLRAQMPRNTYQPGCVHTLFDTGCGLLKASFAVVGTVQAGSTIAQVNTTLAQATGYFDLGTIVFTSGVLNGQPYTVKKFTSATSIVPVRPLAAAPATGDSFTIYPGCDKSGFDNPITGQVNTCLHKFNNWGRFRGFPLIPAAENAR